MPLKRLTHERYRHMRTAGSFPDAEIALVDPSAQPSNVVLTKGGESKQPHWFQVRAIVKRAHRTEYVHLAESPTLREAIVWCSAYPWRALVIDKHSKMQFENGKPIEVDDDRC